MVTDEQFRRLKKLLKTEVTIQKAALKSGMDEKTARKYRDINVPPSQIRKDHDWRTRSNPFEELWNEVCDYLETNPGLEAKTIFEAMQRKYPGKLSDGQLRTLQRHIKAWRALYGPAKEVTFGQVHTPGKLSQSDFTHMDKLGITIDGKPFSHLIYHFVLTYSNFETGNICFSESFESLSEGFQNALFELGAAPEEHQTDQLSTAVNKMDSPEEFTHRYQGLLDHYGIKGKKIQVREPHENGDVEQSHNRFKKALDQALMLRGSRNFTSRKDYEAFLKKLFKQLNSGRIAKLNEELKVMGALPKVRLDACRRIKAKVNSASTARILNNTYSVHSRLIGETIEAKVYAERIDICFAQRIVDRLPRLRGRNKHRINYRHIIDSLLRKPGAFENYRYREDLFPSSTFRIAYDALKNTSPAKADKEYLKLLYLAAFESESGVEDALKQLLTSGAKITEDAVKEMLSKDDPRRDVFVAEVDLCIYDRLLKAAI